MKNLDTAAIDRFAIPGIVLMENAAAAVVQVIGSTFALTEESKCVIVCGKGNNGGDGFAVARHLNRLGVDVNLACFFDTSRLAADALTNYQIAGKLNIPKISDIQDLELALADADFVVDALYGIGFRGRLRGDDQRIADTVNRFGKYVFAVDIPSGLNADTGKVTGSPIKADKTITFTAYKPAQFLFPAADYCGDVVVCDIGIPEQAIESEQIALETIERELVGTLLPKRRKNTHKGDYGKVFVVAGSTGMSGAAYLAGVSAARSGAGLVTLGVPENIHDIIEVKTTEVMSLPLPHEQGSVSAAAEDIVIQHANASDVLLFGPGLSRSDEVAKLLLAVLPKCKVPVIIDADGINALAENKDLLLRRSCPVILTPHCAEMGRLIGADPKDVEADRLRAALTFANEYKVTLILKGHHTIVAGEDGRAYFNHLTGNAGMATGGSGDVLAGVLASLVAAGLKPMDAAVCAVYLHGLAGDIAADKAGMTGMLAGDIMDMLPQAFKAFE